MTIYKINKIFLCLAFLLSLINTAEAITRERLIVLLNQPVAGSFGKHMQSIADEIGVDVKDVRSLLAAYTKNGRSLDGITFPPAIEVSLSQGAEGPKSSARRRSPSPERQRHPSPIAAAASTEQEEVVDLMLDASQSDLRYQIQELGKLGKVNLILQHFTPDMGREDFSQILSKFSSIKKVRSLEFTDCTINVSMARELAAALAQQPQLAQLKLDGVNIDNHAFLAILDSIPTENLRALTFSRVSSLQDICARLTLLATRLKKLRTLDLRGNSLTKEGVLKIVEGFSKLSKLETIWMTIYSHTISYDDIKAIARDYPKLKVV